MKRVFVACALLVAAQPAHAQFGIPQVVHDPWSVAQTTLIAERTLRAYEMLIEQYQQLQLISARLPGMTRYRVPPLEIGGYDVANPLLAILMSGDPRGELYRLVVGTLPAMAISHLPPEARAVVDAQIQNIEAVDAIIRRSAHESGYTREQAGALAETIAHLEHDVTTANDEQSTTAVLDAIAGGTVLGRQMDAAALQMHARALELQIAQALRMRATEASMLRMRAGQLLPRYQDEGFVAWTDWRAP